MFLHTILIATKLGTADKHKSEYSEWIKVRQETIYKIAIDFWSTKITIFLKIHID